MTCRHGRFDPACGSYADNVRQREIEEAGKKALAAAESTPDADNFEILDIAQIGTRMVFKVRYPNCSKCAYEGTKILVYENVTPLIALKWRRIDPHFADPKAKRTSAEAPAPIARFPASDTGWNMALWFADNYGASQV